MSTLALVLVILLIFALIGGLPNWGWHNYGPAPSGIAGVLLVVILILVLLRAL